MNPIIKNVATAYIVPVLLSKIKLKWLALGAIAYYGLKILNDKGVLPAQVNEVFETVDHGIEVAKQKIGFSKPVLGATDIRTTNPVH